MENSFNFNNLYHKIKLMNQKINSLKQFRIKCAIEVQNFLFE